MASSLTKLPERSVLALKKPGDESSEAAGVFLNLADDLEVIHALFDGFAGAEHHGGGGAHAEQWAVR